MDWSKGYASSFRVVRVNEESWGGGAALDGVAALSLSRDGDAPLVESGSVELDAPIQPGYYRMQMLASQDGENVCEDVATLWLEPSRSVVSYDLETRTADGFSVLKRAADRILPDGSFAAAGIDGADKAAELLRSAIAAPVEVFGGFTLDDSIVFDFGASYLDGAWQILNAADWRIRIDGDGTVVIERKPTQTGENVEALAFDSVMMPKLTRGKSADSIPNVCTVVDGERVVTVENSDVSDPYSTANRARVDVLDTSPVRVDGESLEDYAARKLAEASAVSVSYSYDREYIPGVVPFDIVPVGGGAAVSKQTYSFGNGITVSETAVRTERSR